MTTHTDKHTPTDAAEVIAFATAASFERWLDAHVDTSDGVWLKVAKKASGIPSVTSDEAVDIGLCFGWISGQRKSLDDSYYLQKYVPRRPRSRWSQVNVDKVDHLTAAGRMRPTGLAEVAAARDGRWDAAYESQRNATVPADLDAELTAKPHAARVFHAATKTQRYAMTLDLATARTPSTRQRRLQRIVTELESEFGAAFAPAS